MKNLFLVLLFSFLMAVPVHADTSINTVFSTIRLDYSSTNVTTGAWVQISAGIPYKISHMDIFDSSGQDFRLGVGASPSDLPYRIFPGGNGDKAVPIEANTPIWIRAVSGTANSGNLIINIYI